MATAAVPHSNLLDLVHCELCLEKYNDSNRLPKLLNCSHTFCLACVQRYYESKLKRKLTCPNCREVFTVPRGDVQKLKTNIVVINLLDHLAPFSAVDTDEGVAEVSVVPKDKVPEELRPIICGLHPGEKCYFYCNDCRDPLCPDCIVSITEGPHKTHKIRKLRDVLTTYSTQHQDVLQMVTKMNIEGKQRAEELLEELVLSRDSMMKEAKSKRDKAHQESDKWYQNTTATISKVYDELHVKILQYMSTSDLQELQQYLEKNDLQKFDGDLKQAQSFLDELQSSVTSFQKSTIWPARSWSVDVGKITDDFTVDLGSVTEPTLKLPDVNSYTELTKSNICTQITKPEFVLLSDAPMQPHCQQKVGLTTNEAVVCFEGQSVLTKITFDGDQTNVIKQCALPHNIRESCTKCILNNNNVLLRDYGEGPTFILNPQLELVSTIQEEYGIFIGAESTHWTAFKNHLHPTIEIYDLEQKQLLHTLTPPDGVDWLHCLEPSICRHPDSQFIAVLDDLSKLCIYDHDGNHLHTHQLPLLHGPVSCNRRHLYVVAYTPFIGVFVFSWSGQLVAALDLQQLSRQELEKKLISNIAVGEDQFTITLGPGSTRGLAVSSFMTLQLEFV